MSRPNPLPTTVLAVLMFVPLAACSQGSPSGGAAASAAKLSDSTRQELNSFIDQYTKAPVFKAPGPKFDASKAKGKTIFNIPSLSSIPVLQTETKTLNDLSERAGVKFYSYTNKGSATEWASGTNEAIARKANLIMLSGAPKPDLLQPQIKLAKAAGIPTATDHNFDRSMTLAEARTKYNLAADTPAPMGLAAKLMADFAILRSGGNVNVLAVGPQDVQGAQVVFNALRAEFDRVCKTSCKMTILDTPHSQSASQNVSSIQSHLLRDSKINYVMPVFDFLALQAVPAIKQASAADRVKVITYNGTPAVLDAIRTDNVVIMDVGESFEWVAYSAMDQALRLLTGNKPAEKEYTPVRVWTDGNVTEAGVPATATNNFPTPEEFFKLWGVS